MSKKIYEDTKERFNAYRQNHYDEYYTKKRENRNTLEGKFKDLLSKCKTRSNKKQFDFDLTFDFLLGLWHGQDGKCAVSHIDMASESGVRKLEGVNPLVVSIDRIDSSKGYTTDNVQLVCFAVNQIKSNFTEDQFKFWIRTISREAFNDEN